MELGKAYIWRKKPCGTWRKSPAFLFTAKFTTKNPGNVKLYGLDEISKEKYHSECVRELFAKYQRLALRNQYTKVDHHLWVISSRVKLRNRPHSLIEPRIKVCQRRPTSILPQVQRHNMLKKIKWSPCCWLPKPDSGILKWDDFAAFLGKALYAIR